MAVPETEDKNANALVLEVAKMLDMNILPSYLSTFHCFPKKTANSSNNSGSFPIIARFTNRDIKNKIYAKCKKVLFVGVKNFSVSNNKNIFVKPNNK